MSNITKPPSSITIILEDGLPDGLLTINMAGWDGRAIVCPKTRFPEIKARPDFARAGVYVLWGPSADGDLPTVYVGQGDTTRPRLEQHFKNKDFWRWLIVFTTVADNLLNTAHVQYLESRLISLARTAKRCVPDFIISPQLPNLGVADTAWMEAFLEKMLIIYPLLGMKAFEVPSHTTGGKPDTTLYGKRAGKIVARGYDKDAGFVVLAGSKAKKENLPNAQPYLVNLRDRLVKQGVLVADGDHFKFTQDYTFDTPTGAATVLVGGAVNGLLYWKDDQGRTLRAIQKAAIGG